MGITGQVSLARVGQNVRILEQTSDIVDIFDPNATPALQALDHVTLYPGDFRSVLSSNPITIPEDVYVTILPGAIVGYGDITGPLAGRYENINGSVENIADLNIANQYTTEVERQFARVRVYPERVQTQAGVTLPFSGFSTLGEAADAAQNGDTIVVFPGTYSPEENLFVDGVTWNFLDGAIVEYAPQFPNNTYPHALFDDLKNVSGEDDPGGKSCEVRGNAEFVIGSTDAQPTNFSGFDASTTSAADWEGWHMYSILGVNNSASDVDFEAKKVQMVDFADAAIKCSATNEVNVDVGTVELSSSLELDQEVSTVAPRVPSFLVVNGVLPSLNSGDVNVSVDNVEINASPADVPVYFASGLNHNTTNRDPFAGNVVLSAGKSEAQDVQFDSEFIYFSSQTSPNKLIIEETNTLENNSSIVLDSAATFPQTKFVVKDSEISTANNTDRAPIVLQGDAAGFELSLSEVWLLTGDNASMGADFGVQNETGQTNFEIKVYGDSFADAPIEDYQQILHDELDNIAWTEDVSSLL